MDEYESKKIDEIMNELNECREDERANLGQLVQIITAAGAVLGILTGISGADGFPPENMNAIFY